MWNSQKRHAKRDRIRKSATQSFDTKVVAWHFGRSTRPSRCSFPRAKLLPQKSRTNCHELPGRAYSRSSRARRGRILLPAAMMVTVDGDGDRARDERGAVRSRVVLLWLLLLPFTLPYSIPSRNPLTRELLFASQANRACVCRWPLRACALQLTIISAHIYIFVCAADV